MSLSFNTISTYLASYLISIFEDLLISFGIKLKNSSWTARSIEAFLRRYDDDLSGVGFKTLRPFGIFWNGAEELVMDRKE